jgi:hypothetical protein
MTPSRALAALAGLALGAAATGASSALTAMPAIVIVVFGASGAVLALAQPGRRRLTAALLACGALIGAALPRSALAGSGAVVTHYAGGSRRGDIFALLDQIDAEPRALLGRRVTVSGEWSPADRNHAATVSRRVMTCCAADAIRVGFDVAPVRPLPLSDGVIVRVSGVLRARLRDGDVRYVIEDALIRRCDPRRCASP